LPRHARSLIFLHPIRYEPITVTAEPPEPCRDFGATADRLVLPEAGRQAVKRTGPVPAPR